MVKIHTNLPTALFALFLASAPSSIASAKNSSIVIRELLDETSAHVATGEYDLALCSVNAALQLDPHNASAYEIRGSIYIQEKLWDRAQGDYRTAEKIDPSAVAYKYKRAEIYFLKRSYDDARPGFAALEGDLYLGDLATYHVLLCDMLSDDDALAEKDLDAINKVGTNPSYYFGNAAWDLFHNKKQEADKWFNSAVRIYDTDKMNLYISCLIEAQPVRPAIVSFVTKDGARFDNAQVFVDNSGLRVSGPQGWSVVPFDQLPDDLSAFPQGTRAAIGDKRRLDAPVVVNTSRISFTSKPGKHFDEVLWSVEETGLRVLTPEGWITLPYAQFPDDLSAFPPQLQQEILEKKQNAPVAASCTAFASFTTKQGKVYDLTKATLSEDGVRVLTSDGRITVPLSQLPDDLAPFPPAWREPLKAKNSQSPDQTYRTRLVSFTTRQGKPYEQVKASLENDGLRILTDLGWITVPFRELPDDLSAFPGDWQKSIALESKSSPANFSRMEIVSFTTRQGKQYDQTRATLLESGLRVLTDGGWITIPFQQIPADPSPFPEGWRSQIVEKQRELSLQSRSPGLGTSK